MPFLRWLFGGAKRKKFVARKFERVLGGWSAYTGPEAIARTRLPQQLDLPPAVEKLGIEPGRRPLGDVLFPCWLRLDPALCGYAVQQIRAGRLYKRVERARDGGKPPRVLHVPHPFLRFVQRRILERLLEQMEVHPAAHGFVKGRSIFSAAAPHVGKRIVIALDLRDFFPTITFPRVFGLFASFGLPPSASGLLAGLCCFQGRLPQGAPSSPMISNLICRRLDSRLTGLVGRCGGDYTRYADDLIFSGDEPLLKCLPLIRKIVAEEGFQTAPEKTRIMRSGSRQRVTGLNVNTRVAVPRRVRRVIRAMVHNESRAEEPSAELRSFLHGHIAFMKPAHPEEAERLANELR